MLNSLNTSSRVLLPLLEELGTARSLSVAIMLRYGDFAGVLSLKTDPRHYLNAASYFRDSQATNLLKKVRGFEVRGIDRRQSALNKWKDGEKQCYRTNERLAKFNYGGVTHHNDLAIERFLRSVAKTISDWIGPTPPSLDHIEGGFGPGATFTDKGRLTTVPDKITSIPVLTRSAKWYLLPFAQTYWGRTNNALRNGEMSWVRGNRYLTVPKTALIDRSIAVEPAINLFYQKGLGTSIRKRLNTATGWNLDHAQEIHRRIARESSVTKEFSTLDLSNASDTVCVELVRLLLPPAWFEELDNLRSTHTLVDGRWHRLEKFSSMGNGFTFELETLIFAAIASTLLKQFGRSGHLGEDVFVFGDDIIIPDELSGSMVAVLNYLGFSLNPEKSFVGPVGFRESCGGDFFEGSDVRSFYLKDLINDPWQLLPDCNGVRRLLLRLSTFSGKYASKVYGNWVGLLPIPVRNCNGPDDLGDSVLHSSEELWRFKWKHGIRYFRALKVIPSLLDWSHWKGEVVLASALYGIGDGRHRIFSRPGISVFDSGGVTPRNPDLSYKVGWVPRS